MFKLKDTARTPHCGWIYTVRETNVDLEADSFLELVNKAAENLSINNIEKDREILIAEIHDFLCHKSPDGFCLGFKQKYVMTIQDLVRGTTAFFSMLKHKGSGFVSHDRAEARALICSQCKENVPLAGGCFTCHGFDYAISKARGNRSTSIDDKLNICANCKCFLQAMVHVNVKILLLTTNEHRIPTYPEYCWKRQELEAELGASNE